MGLNDKLVALLVWISYGLVITLVIPVLIKNRLFFEGNNRLVTNFNEVLQTITCLILLVLSLVVIAPSTPFLLLFGFLILSLTLSTDILKLPINISCISFNYKRFSISLVSLLLTTYLPWWRRDSLNNELYYLPLGGYKLALTNYQIIIFLLLISTCYWMLSDIKINRVKFNLFIKINYLLIAALTTILAASLIFSTGRLTSVVDMSSWWHWSSFAGPAIQLKSGMVLLNDLPIQYGFGPTLIISAFCNDNCWLGVYWLSSITTCILFIQIYLISLYLNKCKNIFSFFCISLICLLVCLVWPAYPAIFSSVLAFPSTTGARFGPAVTLLSILLIFNARGGQNPKRLAPRFLHMLWILCFVWSPESGLYASAMWIPYFLWVNFFSSNKNKFLSFLKLVFELVGVFLLGVALFTLLFFTVFKDLPLPEVYFAYMLVPPGVLPINQYGSIWFGVCCFGAALITLLIKYDRQIDASRFRMLWLITILCTITFSYFMGRSADNNILNLLPYFTILLFCIRSFFKDADLLNIFSRLLLSSFVAWSVVFGFGFLKQGNLSDQLFTFTPSQLLNLFSLEHEVAKFNATHFQESQLNFVLDNPFNEGQMNNALSNIKALKENLKEREEDFDDVIDSVRYIRERHNESIMIFNGLNLNDANDKLPAWSAEQIYNNLYFFNSSDRTKYLSNVLKRINRPGWIIFARDGLQENRFLEFLVDHAKVYKVTDYLTLAGRYDAIRFSPDGSKNLAEILMRPITLKEKVYFKKSDYGTDFLKKRPYTILPESSYIDSGWDNPSFWGVWALMETATIQLPLPLYAKTLKLEVIPFLTSKFPSEEIKVKVNGIIGPKYLLTDRKSQFIEVPLSKRMLENNYLNIELSFSGGGRPADDNESIDTRILYIGLISAMFE